MLIGISGKATSGKDTVAKIFQALYFRENLNKINSFKEILNFYKKYSPNTNFDDEIDVGKWGIIKFGDRLKECVAALIHCNVKDLYNQEYKKCVIPWLGMTVREILQKMGDAGRQCIKEDIWVRSVTKNYVVEHGDFLVPDVRFPNEYNAIKNFSSDSLCIKIEKPGLDTGNHISEIALDDVKEWDYVIINDGTLDDLVQKVKQMIIDLNLKK